MPATNAPPAEPWLFVALTPYHLLLSLLVSSAAPAGVRCDVVAPTTFAGFGEYCGAVERRRVRSGMWPRVRVEVLWCPTSGRRAKAAVVRKVARHFRAGPYGRVFVCHDSRPESLALAHLARRRGVPVSWVEDGLGAYGRAAPAIGLTSRAAVALSGGWVSGAVAHGGRAQRIARCFAHGYCTAPELLPPELGPARQIPLQARPLDAAAAVLVSDRQLDPLPARPAPGFVVAPLSDSPMAPRCAELVHRLDAERAGWDGPIVVKYHPRETAGDHLGLHGRPGYLTLDPSVPLEAYLLRRGAAFVAGPPSTALLFARRALPGLPVAAFDLDSEVGRVLERAGVRALPSTGPTGLIP